MNTFSQKEKKKVPLNYFVYNIQSISWENWSVKRKYPYPAIGSK